ncbi:MAG: glycosyltransferase family 2 protein [Candidatus Woesearchaeota archaeon]
MKISVVIPAYNEEKRLPNALKQVQNYLKRKNWDYEILVVDDGSRDRTKNIVKAAMKNNRRIKLLEHGPNRGKGYSVRQGMLSAKGDWLLFTDADMSAPMREFDKFLKYMKDYDIIIGSRNLAQSQITIKQPKFRQLAGKTFPFVVRVLLALPIKDTQCGFKLFSKKVAKDVFSKQRLERWAFDAEILFIAYQCGYRIKEVPVEWANDPASKLRFFRDSWRMFCEILRVRKNAFLGYYQSRQSR